MTPKHRTSEVRMIPIDRIDVLNPRDRNKQVFEEIVGNIKTIGLKKPITVTPRKGEDGTERYLLVCGEGRLDDQNGNHDASTPCVLLAGPRGANAGDDEGQLRVSNALSLECVVGRLLVAAGRYEVVGSFA